MKQVLLSIKKNPKTPLFMLLILEYVDTFYYYSTTNLSQGATRSERHIPGGKELLSVSCALYESREVQRRMPCSCGRHLSVNTVGALAWPHCQ